MKYLVQAAFCITIVFCSAVVGGQTTADYEALIQQGKTQLQAGHADQALATGEQAIKLDAKRWEGYALDGVALLSLKRYDEAISRLTDAMERAPQEKQARLSDLRKDCFAAEWAATVPRPVAAGSTAPPATPDAHSPLPVQAASQPPAVQTTTAQSPASVAEILAWISQHLVAEYDPPPSPGLTKSETTKAHITTGMVFEGCTVFYVSQTNKQFVKTSAGKSQDSDYSSDSYIVDLSQAIPDKISVATDPNDGEIDLTIPFSGKMPHLNTDFSTLEYSDSTSGYDFEDKLIVGFTTQEMADRQAKAWRDAIAGCQRQAAPENLY